MEEALKKLLLYITTKQFNMTDEEATELIFDAGEDEGALVLKKDAGDLLLAKAASKVKTLKDERQAYFDNGYKKAEKEVMSKAEAKFRELTGWDGEAEDFADMVTKFSASKNKAPKLSDDAVKAHPLFIALEKERVPKTEYEQLKGEFDQFKNASQKEKTLAVVRGKAWDTVARERPILSENQAVAENRKNDFLAKLAGYDFDDVDGATIVMKEGKRLEDEHGNPKTFDSFVMELARLNFDFQGQEDRGNSGQEGRRGPATITETPKTKAELNAVYDKYSGNTEEDAKKRIAALDYYEKNATD